jgi:two-component system, OmpR family, sensor histidine kinase KdpD
VQWVQSGLRLLASVIGVAIITWIGYGLVGVNATTVGFAYLLFVLTVATTWGFPEATVSAFAAALAFNYFFLDPRLTFTIADPHNWIALFAFLATAIIASRLSTETKRRTQDAIERQRDLERLYTFGRAILLIGDAEPFPKQLARRLAETFELDAVALYESRGGEIYRAGPEEFDGMETQLREAALQGTSFADPERNRVITSIRLGAAPVGSLAVQGSRMPDSVLQSVANLVAIGLERAKAQDLAHQVEVAKRSEQLRTTLLDAMAHEFKTPLTAIRAATSALRSERDMNAATAASMLKIADEEAAHLEELIDNALDMAQLENERIDLELEASNLDELVEEVVSSMKNRIGDRQLVWERGPFLPSVVVDRRLIKLGIKQLLDNALKYSPVNSPVVLHTSDGDGRVALNVTDHGRGIPEAEQGRIFERFYRSPTIEKRIPGSGLGLSIAQRIMKAHGGDLSVKSRLGETTFSLVLPSELNKEEPN